MSQPEPPPTEAPNWDTLGRQLGAYTVAFANAVAERVGINRTDYECLDLLDAHGGALTAGQITKMKVQGSPDGSDWTVLGGDLAGVSKRRLAWLQRVPERLDVDVNAPSVPESASQP